MLDKHINSKKQGDAGLGVAIGWFAINGVTISLPLTDSQDYDLIVDINDKLGRVQVKTTTFKKGDFYRVNLRVCGGNRSGQTIKHFDKTKVEHLFVYTKTGDKYFIPSQSITSTNQLTLNQSFDKYKV